VKIIEKQVYLGPNLYANFPVMRLLLDLEELEDWPSRRLGPSFIDPLLEALPGLNEHGCSYRKPGGFVRRLREDEGTWMGHILEHVALELQNMAGGQVSFGRTRSSGEPGHYNVVYQYAQREVGREAGELAFRLLDSLLPAELQSADHPSDFDFEEELDELIRFTQRRALGPSTAALVRAAEERDIPWVRLNQYSLVQLGFGKNQRRIQATVTSQTRHIAVEIASDKEEAAGILSKLGLPVPQQRCVRTEAGAVQAARRIGFPVVVKPLNANHGRGASLNLTDDEHVATAFGHANQYSRSVIVESFIEGQDHRMLVIDGKLIAVAKRVPGHVVGDGEHTIAELVDITNADPRRGIGHEKVLTRIEIDHQAERLLEQFGYGLDTVPPADEVVYLRSTGNLSTGGTAVDVTDQVHPDNREMAVRAALAVGLDVAGVDFLTTDITESFKDVGGAICEVNAAPGFRMHVAPSQGEPRDAAGPVIDMLYPQGTPSRVPIAAITGTNGKTTTTRMLAHIHKLAGKHVGVATTDGVYIDGHATVEGDMTGPIAARMVLSDPAVDVAVLETARGGLLRAGMGYRNCDVSCCLNVSADHLGLRGIDTLEQLAEVKRIPIEVTTDTVVLNADDSLCLKMADHTDAKHICYVTMNPRHSLVAEHIQAGGRGVVLEEGIHGHMITLYDNGVQMPLLWSKLIPATLEGRAIHNVQNAMFAAGMAHSMDVGLEDIRHGLRTFDTTFFQAPGRMNIFDGHPFKVILDYGHNPAAVRAMVEMIGRLSTEGRGIVVLAAPGDRRDDDVREIAAISAGKFDHYICRRDDNLRGRGAEEIPQLLRDTLLANGVDAAQVDIVPDEVEATERALQTAAAGDLVLIFGDAIERTWRQIENFSSAPPAGETAAPKAEAPAPLPDLPEVVLEEGESLIRDERGVRIARVEEEAD